MKHNSKFAKMVISMVWLLALSIMLIGTTFAWFTDTVTNTGNRIQAGTLSVQLLKHDGSAYQEITNGEGDIFESSIKWEPGYTKIVWLAVKNDGNLPLKYTVKLDIAEGETSLIGALTYGFVVGAEYSADNEKLGSWAEIRGDSRTQGKSDVTAGIMTLASEVELAAEATDYFALVVHMEESATDIYQGASIDIDMKIVAKQTSEDAEGPVDWERKMPDGILTFEVGEPSTAVKEGSPAVVEGAALGRSGYVLELEQGDRALYSKAADLSAGEHMITGYIKIVNATAGDGSITYFTGLASPRVNISDWIVGEADANGWAYFEMKITFTQDYGLLQIFLNNDTTGGTVYLDDIQWLQKVS